MQVPSPPQTSAALLACSALAVVLLLSLAIAVFEAAGAIKRKMAQRAVLAAQRQQQHHNSTGEDLNNNSGNNNSDYIPPTRNKKCSLSEFTWMRHLRQRITTNAGDSTSSSGFQRQHDMSPPQVSITSSDPSVKMMAEVLLDSEPSTCWSVRPTVESFRSPVSQMSQMGPVRFYGCRPSSTAARRISSPDGRNNTSCQQVHLRTKRISATAPRRSYAGMTPYTALPLTPGVARMCGSLSDINEATALEGESDTTNSLSPVLPGPRPALLTVDHAVAAAQSTAWEARLKRIRIIRHR